MLPLSIGTLASAEAAEIMKDEEFVWNDEKAKSNRKKHKVSFETARGVFSDPDRIEDDDRDSSFDEDRFFAIGEAGNTVYFVVFAILDDGRTRIISARRANKNQTDDYNRRKTTG